MLLANLKSVINYTIELNMDYLEIFLGYEGVQVLYITTGRKEVVVLVKAYAKTLNLECISEYDVSGKYGAAHNLYIGEEASSIYKFKNKEQEHNTGFKTRLVLEVLKEKQTVAEIAYKNNISPKLLWEWKETFLANADMAMEAKENLTKIK
jgi:hypothetical protein